MKRPALKRQILSPAPIEFDSFLGLDQTGACLPGGQKAKPLKVCLMKREGSQWKAYTQNSQGKPLTLASLCESAVAKFLEPFAMNWPNPKLAIHVDCVLGLPHSAWPKDSNALVPRDALWGLFHLVKQHRFQGMSYGRFASQNFFEILLKLSSQNGIPLRECEKYSGSNSVFTTRPFQKNIQTGTYRLWRDLAQDGNSPWLHLWPFDWSETPPQDNAWLFEGYPSLLWKKYLNLSSRDPKALGSWVRRFSKSFKLECDTLELITNDCDHADSFVLALCGLLLQREQRLFTPFPNFSQLPQLRREGWITGLQIDLE